MYDRVIKLIGEENLQKLKSTTVAVVGLGGVGGYAVECLVRSGIENIIMVVVLHVVILSLGIILVEQAVI